MIYFRVGQYLLFEKGIGKINKLGRRCDIDVYSFDSKEQCVKIRMFTKGNTKRGYDWQKITSIDKLKKLYKENKLKIISPNEILEVLFANYEGCMPIRDMRGI